MQSNDCYNNDMQPNGCEKEVEDMTEMKAEKNFLLCNCEDKIHNMVFRLNFWREVYSCVGPELYEVFLFLVFEELDRYSSVLSEVEDGLESARKMPDIA